MSVEDHPLIRDPRDVERLVLGDAPEHLELAPKRGMRPSRPRVRRLRLLLVVISFVSLAGASALFGILTSIASDLPKLQNTVQFHERVDSYLYDSAGKPIGVLAPADDSVIDSWGQISPYMREAIVAVEDKRFWSDPGVDVRGLLRALVSDLTGGPHEGASTIPEEFVKNVLGQEGNRTILEKVREAGLAFQLVHKWKRRHILVSYLNTIYFGNGANGVEAAARVYFGRDYGYNPADPAGEPRSACGDPDAQDPGRPECASKLNPAQAALLAGMVANPSEFDPTEFPDAARARRNLVLGDMYQQHYISRHQYEVSRSAPLPSRIQLPQEPAEAPYFVSWVRPLIVRALQKDGIRSYNDAEYEALYGGLKIRLTLNLQMQAAAQQAVDQVFPPGSNGPTASLVAIDNRNGEVRAMVSGNRPYDQASFNLATLGYRQPGSAFKIFTLAAALSSGRYGPESVIDSKPLRIHYGHSGAGVFVVHNFGNAYAGPETLATATAVSDNSVFAQVGMHVPGKTQGIKQFAERMGIRSPISTTPAMILGGLSTGVSALDLAHAYETAATGGLKIWNPILGDIGRGPIGIASLSGCAQCTRHGLMNDRQGGLTRTRELSPAVAATIGQLLHGPVDDPSGTGTAAAIPGVDVVGKTGTTSNYVDAWFVGWTPQLTVAVWVGYPNSGKPMLTDFRGGPVEGGTYPAIIWHDFVVRALQILSGKSAGHQPGAGGVTSLPGTTTSLTTNQGSQIPAQPATGQTPSRAQGGNPRSTNQPGGNPQVGTGGTPQGANSGSTGGTTQGAQPTHSSGAAPGTGGGTQGAGSASPVTTTPSVVTTPAAPSAPATTPATAPSTPTGASGGSGL